MSKTSLKIGPLPDKTPQKLTVLIEPSLAAELEDYARVHSQLRRRADSLDSPGRRWPSAAITGQALATQKARPTERPLPIHINVDAKSLASCEDIEQTFLRKVVDQIVFNAMIQFPMATFLKKVYFGNFFISFKTRAKSVPRIRLGIS